MDISLYSLIYQIICIIRADITVADCPGSLIIEFDPCVLVLNVRHIMSALSSSLLLLVVVSHCFETVLSFI